MWVFLWRKLEHAVGEDNAGELLCMYLYCMWNLHLEKMLFWIILFCYDFWVFHSLAFPEDYILPCAKSFLMYSYHINSRGDFQECLKKFKRKRVLQSRLTSNAPSIKRWLYLFVYLEEVGYDLSICIVTMRRL